MYVKLQNINKLKLRKEHSDLEINYSFKQLKENKKNFLIISLCIIGLILKIKIPNKIPLIVLINPRDYDKEAIRIYNTTGFLSFNFLSYKRK